MSMKWGKACKKPVEIMFREPDSSTGVELIATKEGVMSAYAGLDYVIEGVAGELYPIKKKIFTETYTVLKEIPE